MSEEITTIDANSFKNKIESLNGKKVRINYSNNTYYEGKVENGELKEGTIYINGKKYNVKDSKIENNIKLYDGTIIKKSEASLYIDDKLNIIISKDGKNGPGLIIYSNGTVYEGEFRDGERNGYGIIKTISSNEIKEGFFEDDKLKYGVINKKEKENIYLQYEVKNFDKNKIQQEKQTIKKKKMEK